MQPGQGIVEARRGDTQGQCRRLVEGASLCAADVAAQLDGHGANAPEGVGDVIDLEGDLAGLDDLALVLRVLRGLSRGARGGPTGGVGGEEVAMTKLRWRRNV